MTTARNDDEREQQREPALLPVDAGGDALVEDRADRRERQRAREHGERSLESERHRRRPLHRAARMGIASRSPGEDTTATNPRAKRAGDAGHRRVAPGTRARRGRRVARVAAAAASFGAVRRRGAEASRRPLRLPVAHGLLTVLDGIGCGVVVLEDERRAHPAAEQPPADQGQHEQRDGRGGEVDARSCPRRTRWARRNVDERAGVVVLGRRRARPRDRPLTATIEVGGRGESAEQSVRGPALPDEVTVIRRRWRPGCPRSCATRTWSPATTGGAPKLG